MDIGSGSPREPGELVVPYSDDGGTKQKVTINRPIQQSSFTKPKEYQ
jgi:hypothetical protein